MGGHGSGRPAAGYKAPNIRIKSITLNQDQHFGAQLRQVRKLLKMPTRVVAERTGWHLSNVSHFENPKYKASHSGSIQTCLTYAKALGIREIKFKL